MIENISIIVIAFSAFVTAAATIVMAIITRRLEALSQGFIS